MRELGVQFERTWHSRARGRGKPMILHVSEEDLE